MGVGRNRLNVYLTFDGFLRRVFSLLRVDRILYIYNALAWRHRFSLSKILSAFFTRSLARVSLPSVHDDISLQNPSSPGTWHKTPFTATSIPKLIFFTPISADGRSSHYRLTVLANHLASILFLPLSGDSLGLPSLWPGHRMQTSVGFHSDLDLLLEELT